MNEGKRIFLAPKNSVVRKNPTTRHSNLVSEVRIIGKFRRFLTFEMFKMMHFDSVDLSPFRALGAEDLGARFLCLSLAFALSTMQVTVRFALFHPNFEEEHPGGGPTSLPLPPTSREDFRLNG
ncbi:hypothetical protein TNCV_3628591 [Trichonephila clavipes]|nr:hypothetical protein TNCV_3628591 [Trichonephila clavipes]